LKPEEKMQKYDELTEFINEAKSKPGPLMPIMQKAQELFGALSFDVQKHIATQLDIPMSDIYGVATFYSQFSLEPKGKHVIGVCMGTACYVKNSEPILNKLAEELQTPPGYTTPDAQFTLEATRCLGCCGLAPVIMIDDQVYGRLKPDDIPGILNKYRG
jgi:NADH:ubiquinone oxidoreductase subunit E